MLVHRESLHQKLRFRWRNCLQVKLMEYTDYCPECKQQITVEEDMTRENLYVFKNAKGDVIRHCPKCKIKLTIVDGEVKKDTV